MTRLKSLAVVGACLLSWAVAGAARAEDSDRWGNVRGWDIMIDRTLGNGCFIFSEFRDGTAIRLGFDRTKGDSYLMVGNRDWDKIEDGAAYDIEIRMDRAAPWTATATGVLMGSLPLLMARTDDVKFVAAFAKKNSIQVIYGGNTIAHLSLKGTFAAITEMLNCQDAMDG